MSWDKLLDYSVQIRLPSVESYMRNVLSWDTLEDTLEQT